MALAMPEKTRSWDRDSSTSIGPCSKTFIQRGGPSLELRFEYFNVFNHTQFNNIDQNSGDGNFGQVTTAYDPRTLQLGGKFHF